MKDRRTWLVIGALAGTVVILAAVLMAIHLTRAGAPAAASTSRTTTPAASTTRFVVYFHRGAPDDPGKVVAVNREAPSMEVMATAALTALLPGPTAAERETGYWSMFSPSTVRTLNSVRIADGVAHADFLDFSSVIPDAGTSFGSTALLAELDATLKQFPTVTSTVYSFNGDAAAFYRWLRLDPPASAR